MSAPDAKDLVFLGELRLGERDNDGPPQAIRLYWQEQEARAVVPAEELYDLIGALANDLPRLPGDFCAIGQANELTHRRPSALREGLLPDDVETARLQCGAIVRRDLHAIAIYLKDRLRPACATLRILEAPPPSPKPSGGPTG